MNAMKTAVAAITAMRALLDRIVVSYCIAGDPVGVSPDGTAREQVATFWAIADYIRDNKITETPVHRGDPGPNIDLPLPPGWKVIEGNTGTSYGGIVLAQPANPSDPPTIVAQLSKLTGNVDQAKLIQYASGDLQNLPGYDGSAGNASTLGNFAAWQPSGSYNKNVVKRIAAQKTVIIPAQGAVFVLELDADSIDSDQGALMDAVNIIDDQTTITL